MPNNISVSITADVADLQVKRAVLSAELKAATKDLNTFAKEAASSGSTDALREGMLASASAAATARTAIASVNAELEALTAAAAPATAELNRGFTGASVRIREFGGMMRENIAVIGGLREAMMAAGEAMIAAFAIEGIAHWAKSLGEAAEKTEHLSAIMGMTTAQVQGLSGAATLSGTNIDTLAKAIAIFDNKALSATTSGTAVTKSFAAMGVSANDGRSNMERLLTVADKFHGMADGPTKTALAMQLFGKSGKEMVPFLNQGSEAIDQLMEKTKEYGGVNDKAIEQGARLATSVNESTVAWSGLKNTLTEAFGPLLTQGVDGFNAMVASMHASYEAGGAVKIVFDGLVEVFRGLGEVIATVGDMTSEVFSTTGAKSVNWSNDIKAAVDIVVAVFKGCILTVELLGLSFKSGCEEMIGIIIGWYGNLRTQFQMAGAQIEIIKIAFQTFGAVAEDALTLHWGSIAADWDRGMRQIDEVVQSRGKQIVADAKSISDQAKGWLASAAGDDAKAQGLLKTDLFGKHAGPQHDNFKFNTAGGGGDAPDIAASHKGKKGKDTLVQDLEAELEAQKTAWAKEQDLQGTFQQFSLQSEADYWATALQRKGLNEKDKMAIEQKYLAARQGLLKDQIDQQLNVYRQEMTAAGNNSAAKLGILQKERDYIVQMYGAESKEARAANDAVAAGAQAAARQLEQIELNHQKALQQIHLADINEQEKDAQQRVALGIETQSQLIAEERNFENQRWQIRQQALAAEIAAAKGDEVKQKQLLDQQAAEYQAHQNQLTAIDRKAVLERTAVERQAIQSVTQNFTQSIAQMLTLQQGFAASFKSIWQSLQQAVASVLQKIVEQWLVQHGVMTAIGKLFGIHDVSTSAGRAAAAAYASTAAIPIVGPALAPAAAAAAGAGASAIGLSMMSAAGGDWQVKAGLYELHKDEMVLPAWAATPLRNIVQGGSLSAPSAANSNGAGGGGGHNFYGPVFMGDIKAMDGQSVKQFAMANGHHLAAGVKKAVRDGWRG